MFSYFLALASASRTNSSPHPPLSHDEFPVGLDFHFFQDKEVDSMNDFPL